MHRAIVLAAVSCMWLASAAGAVQAQTVPPPPAMQKPAADAPRDLEVRAETTKPAPSAQPRAADGILGDIEDQNALSAIDQQRDQIRELVLKARINTQNFNIMRAKLSEIISAGKCAGTTNLLASIGRQEEDTRKLLQNLDKNCHGAGAGTTGTGVAAMCRDERRKLDDELKGYAEDRAAVRRMCPSGEG